MALPAVHRQIEKLLALCIVNCLHIWEGGGGNSSIPFLYNTSCCTDVRLLRSVLFLGTLILIHLNIASVHSQSKKIPQPKRRR